MSDPLEFLAPDQPTVSVIIIAWKSAPHLDTCLRALAQQADVSYEVILICNEPDEDLLSYVDDETSGIRTITTRVNVGYGGAVNLGVARAKGEFIVLLNDDTEVLAGWLETLVATARRRPRAGAVGSTTLFPDGTVQEAGSVIWADGTTVKVGRDLPGDSKTFDFERRVDHCSGTSLLVRKKSWDAIRGMDAEAYYPAYYEDTDFCLRLIGNGEEVWYQPRSYIRHLESASTNSSYRTFLFEKNGAVFKERWAEELRHRVHPIERDESEIQAAVWRAMGSPVRVLVIDEEPSEHSELLGKLQSDGSCHLTVFAPFGLPDNTFLCELGIGIVVGDGDKELEDHLSRDSTSYEVVVVAQPEGHQHYLSLVTRSCSGVPVVTFANDSLSVDAVISNQPDGDVVEVTSWTSVVNQARRQLP